MHLIRRLPEALDRPTAVAIGNFDGLHRGHQAVIGTMKRAAATHGLTPTVLTFEPHPRRFFKPDVPDFRIEPVRTKLARFAQEGVVCAVVPRFNAAFASMTADAFMADVLATRLNAKVVVVGENFVFGHKRTGDVQMLRHWGVKRGIEIITVPPVMMEGQICSSSAVRAAITLGDMPLVSKLLGRAYMLSGRVVRGDGRGATIGYPTANISLSPHLLHPAFGVYAVHVGVDGSNYQGVANFGVRPTVADGAAPKLEVHLFDTHQKLYGKMLRVFLIKRLREERAFSNFEALAEQIINDSLHARTVLGGLQ